MMIMDTRADHLAVARQYVSGQDDWPLAPRFDPANRWYHRLAALPDHEVWLLTWLPGQGTDLHDHGGSDPRSEARLPVADRYDLAVIVFCQEGYTSSLAAAALQDLGLRRATDLAGGFAAWQSAGLPTTPANSPERTAK